MLASINLIQGTAKDIWLIASAMLILLLFSGNVFSASLSNAAESIDIEFERHKLLRYEQRIARLETTIQRLHSQLELLAAEQDSLEVRVFSLKKTLQQVSDKYATVGPPFESSEAIDEDALQRLADFEIYLAERKYNRVLKELNEIQDQMSRTTEYLQDRVELLKRNRQGVVWQKQVLRKYRNTTPTEPALHRLSERLAQAQ